jgi:hypothetical protein
MSNSKYTVYSPLARKVYDFQNESSAVAFYEDFVGDAVLFKDTANMDEKVYINTFEKFLHSALYILHGITKYPDKETIQLYSNLLPLFKHPKKGVLLMGNKGVGKTTIMRVFRMGIAANFIGGTEPFEIVETLKIKNAFLASGYEGLTHLEIGADHHKHICLDKVNVEYSIAKFFGNQTNILAEVVEDRYTAYLQGIKTHMTTILLPKDLQELFKKETYDVVCEMFVVYGIEGTNKRAMSHD